MEQHCSLSQFECDEIEFEGVAAGSQRNSPHQQLEVSLAVCLVAMVALFLARKLLSRRWRPSRPSSPTLLPALRSPGSQPSSPLPHSVPRSQLHGRSTAATAPASQDAAGPSAWPTFQKSRSFSPQPASPPSELRFSASPKWRPTAGSSKGPSTSPLQLLQSPTSLLAHLSALGRRLAPHHSSPLWQLLGSNGAGRDAAAAAAAAKSPRGSRYGLGLGEAESADEESDDDFTSKQVRALQQSPAFHHYLRGRGLTPGDVAKAGSKLRLYRRLRELDPSGFWLLCRADNIRSFETQDPTQWELVCEYFATLAANLASGLALYYALAGRTLPAVVRAACIAAAWWLTGSAWMQGRSSGGRLLGMWYEELRWGLAVQPWRAAAADLLELVYVLFTFGIGAVLSLGVRLFKAGNSSRSGRVGHQSIGEMCAGVRQVKEVEQGWEEVQQAGGQSR